MKLKNLKTLIMSESLQNKKHKGLKKIRQFLKQKLTVTTCINSWKRLINRLKPLKLYDTPEKLKAKLFFEILNSEILNKENLGLLKANPFQKAKSQLLNDTWNDLKEFYFSNTNERNWKSFKDGLRKLIRIENDIAGCEAALQKVRLGFEEEGYEALKLFKVYAKSIEGVISAINIKKTSLRLTKAKIESTQKREEKKEALSFYDMLGDLELQAKYQIDENVSLANWVGKIKAIKKRQEAERNAAEAKGSKNNNINKKRVR